MPEVVSEPKIGDGLGTMAGEEWPLLAPQIPSALVIGNMANPGLGPLVSPQIVASLIVTIRQCRTQPIQSVYFGIRCYAGPLELGFQGGPGGGSPPSRFGKIETRLSTSKRLWITKRQIKLEWIYEIIDSPK